MPTIQVLVFRGTGKVSEPDQLAQKEPALVRAGHCGISGVIEGKIIGFHPTPEVETVLGEERLLDALTHHEAQPGYLQDDDSYFLRAYQLSQLGERTTVYFYSVDISEETLEKIKSCYTEKKEELYNFPYEDGQFEEGHSNCAMFWPLYFGIRLPIKTGSIKQLVEKMQQNPKEYKVWQPKS
jgi:hypothetical protein